MSNERIKWIDTAKGIGIILVIMGHLTIGSEMVRVWFYTFHIPLFFFLSGITFNYKKYEKFAELIKSRIKTLIIPYLLFAVIYFAWGTIRLVILKEKFDYLRSFIGLFLDVRGTKYSISLWFLTCLFVVEIIAWIIIKTSKNIKGIIMLQSVVSVIIGYLYIRYVGILAPWAVEVAMIAVAFFNVGYCYKEYINRINNAYILLLIVNIFAGVMNFKLSGIQVDMYANRYGNIFLFFVAAFCGIVFICALCKNINLKIISGIGENSLYFFGMHFIIKDIINRITANTVLNLQNQWVQFIVSLCLTAVCLCILYLFVNLYKKILKVLVGKVSF